MPQVFYPIITLIIYIFYMTAAYAEDKVADNDNYFINRSELVVEYSAGFFSRFSPNTALDMVNQVPGFQIDDGDLNRGFSETIGNILINDNYVSAKQDRPSATIDRIPANQVEKIELIRGNIRGINLQEYPLVVNIILKESEDISVRWEFFYEELNSGPDKPGLNFSVSSRWRDVDYLAGFRIQREASGEYGPENLVNTAGKITEVRNDKRDMTGIRLVGNLNASTKIGETLAQLNANLFYKTNNSLFNSDRFLLPSGLNVRKDTVDERENQKYIEVGFDAERKLTSDFLGKAILIFFYQEIPLLARRRVVDYENIHNTLRIADSTPKTLENIIRFEFDWDADSDHLIRFNLEGAFNSLNNFLLQTVDSGDGPEIVDIPGANTKIEELRGDFLLKDTWSLNSYEIDYGLGAEISAISQTGDVTLERTFFFLKPTLTVTYSHNKTHLTRLQFRKEVSQLNFNDFVSSTVFEENDLAFGNPELRPETTWELELEHEARITNDNVISIKVFHHWINNVEDLLPLTDTFEVPGNIGNGRRWGTEFESSHALDFLGFIGAKLDIKYRWQDSSVLDPITRKSRVLSSNGGFAGPPRFHINRENEYAYNISLRQDLERLRFAWGTSFANHAERPLYNVNELEIYHEGQLLNAFIETTRWLDMKMRLEGSNLFDYNETRDKTVFEGRRGITPVGFALLRSRKPGRRITLTLTGNF